MANNRYGNRDFQKLAAQINNALIKNDGLIGDQKEQVDLVFSLERKFKHFILKYQKTKKIYQQFIYHITVENGNILNAKPYFREKKEVFNSKISKAIKEEDVEELCKYDINYKLIDFIVEKWNGPLPDMVNRYYKEFIQAREILIENNLPLAINRAKLFFKKTPRSHLTLLDLIGICTCGLISGIDKYAGDYTKVWRSVCIGRMVGYMIEEYSKTFLRMYPVDKKILYRANALKYRMKIDSVEELTDVVNESFEKDKEEGKKVPKLPISEIHIRTLLNGCSYISAENKKNEDEGTTSIYDYTPDEDITVEQVVVNKDIFSKISKSSSELSILEKKVIRLKGVEI